MKKLMIAAAIVCAAALSQAANVNWTINDLTDKSGEKLSGGYVYTFVNVGTYKEAAAAVRTALLACTDAASFKSTLEGFDSIAGLSGEMTAVGTYSASDAAGNLGVAKGTKGTSLYSIVLDGATIETSQNWYMTGLSGSANFIDPDGQTDFIKSVSAASSATPTNWNAIPVPEPTSGLLLLLGVAGMALRRRRA